jgi:hypothetical protein
VTNRLAQLALEQDRLKEVLNLLVLPAPGSPDWNGKAPLSPNPSEPRETLPTPKRRTWSPEAREAQRKRMKAHWREQKRNQKAK